ncbi:MAG: HNH endonuclease, partial [Gemmatimonadetes bacterium]|nr:HNH endonuclease [Gemmatimonadota bacterium]
MYALRERISVREDWAPEDHGLRVHDGPAATDPDDELFLLGEQCAETYLQADALHYQAMKLLVEFHHRDGWKDTGFSSTPEWLAWRIGIKLGPARERLRTALALEELPQTSEALRTGELSFTKVRALTRVATPDNETTLLDFARAGSAANLERVVRGWKRLDRRSEITAEQIRYRSRRFSAYVDEDGMVMVRGRLDPEAGAVFMRAVEAATDALYREEAPPKEGGGTGTQTGKEPMSEFDETSPEQRRADAVGLLAERALAAGFGKGVAEEGESGGDEDQDSVPISGSRAERYQVMLHVAAETLRDDVEPGQSELEDGTRVSAETSRRMACDCGVVRIGHGPEGQVVEAGRRKRTVSPSLRRALEARDRGCRFPGCGLRFTDAHHVKHWADGGETSLRNLVLLCRKHHRAVHEGGATVCIDANQQIVFFTPKGKALFGAPAPRLRFSPEADGGRDAGQGSEGKPGRPPGKLAGAYPGAYPGAARWSRDSEIPWALEAQV